MWKQILRNIWLGLLIVVLALVVIVALGAEITGALAVHQGVKDVSFLPWLLTPLFIGSMGALFVAFRLRDKMG